MKHELIQWILKNTDSLSKADTKQFVPLIINLLSDKNKDIKLLAEQFLEKLAEIITIEPFVNALKDLKVFF